MNNEHYTNFEEDQIRQLEAYKWSYSVFGRNWSKNYDSKAKSELAEIFPQLYLCTYRDLEYLKEHRFDSAIEAYQTYLTFHKAELI